MSSYPHALNRLLAAARFALAAATVVFAAARAANMQLDIYAGNINKVAIALLPFSPRTAPLLTDEMPWDIVADDFEFCGRFAVTRLAAYDAAALAAADIGLLIDGEYTLSGDSITVECVLRAADSRTRLAGKRSAGHRRDTRRMAHRFAGEIYETLFAERGPFESRILFVRDQGESKHVCCIDFDGTTVRQLTDAKTVNIFPCFAGADRFVWVSYQKVTPDLFIGSLGGTHRARLLHTPRTETSPSYSAAEDRLVYASSASDDLEIYTCDMAGGDITRLTFNRAIDTSPCWSPDGYQIAFVSDRTGQPLVYIIDREGGNLRRLTQAAGYQDSPAWSPRGDCIAFAALQDGKLDIWTVAPDGSNARRLTNMPGKHEYPSWAPDGSRLVFQSTRFGRRELCTIRPDGSGLRRLTGLGDAAMPDWSSF